MSLSTNNNFPSCLALSALFMLSGATNGLAGEVGLTIHGNDGKDLAKPDLFSKSIPSAWEQGKAPTCDAIRQELAKPGDFSAYDIECALGSVVEVKPTDSRPDGFTLKVILEKSNIKANYTQPVAGKWADPSVDVSWEGFVTLQANYTKDGVCPGTSQPLPQVRYTNATLEVLSPDVRVHSTTAAIVSGVTGLFGGLLFGGTGSIPLAIASSMGTSAIIDGQARQLVPKNFDFTRTANEVLLQNLTPCEVKNTFGAVLSKFQTQTISPNQIGVTVTNPLISDVVKEKANPLGSQGSFVGSEVAKKTHHIPLP